MSYNLSDLKIGMEVDKDELKDVLNTYMIILYENETDSSGKLVYFSDTQDENYGKWFLQSKPITPIYNSSEEAEEAYVYDE